MRSISPPFLAALALAALPAVLFGEHVFSDGFESRNTLAWSTQAPPLIEPDVYRWTDLDLRDPHVYADLPIFGCEDVTDTSPLGAQLSINSQIQQSISTDGNLDGKLDLSWLLAFRPFDALADAGRLDQGDGACPAPSPPASCDWRMPPVPRTVDYDGLTAGTCLEPLASTTHGYSPAVDSVSAPCYVSGADEMSVLLFGARVTLRAARSAAVLGAGDPPADLTSGLWRGFLRESDADAALITVPQLGTAPLSSYLPGGTGNCAAHNDRDLGPQGESGWWIYFEFVAAPFLDEPIPVCGNGIAEAGEDCDGPDLDGQTCASVDPSNPTGILGCTPSCDFDTTGCLP